MVKCFIVFFSLVFLHFLSTEIVFQIKYVYANLKGYIVEDYVIDFGSSKHYTMIQTGDTQFPESLDKHMVERQLWLDHLWTILYVSKETGFYLTERQVL